MYLITYLMPLRRANSRLHKQIDVQAAEHGALGGKAQEVQRADGVEPRVQLSHADNILDIMVAPVVV